MLSLLLPFHNSLSSLVSTVHDLATIFFHSYVSTVACPASTMFFPVHSVLLLASFSWAHIPSLQGLMQDENVACRDLGKVLFEYAVSCFGMSQLERATRFPNVPTGARDSFLSNHSRQAYSPAYVKHSFIATCYVFQHTIMMPVTLSWPNTNSKDAANFAKL